MVPVAPDDTLGAMRALQASFARSNIRLLKARIAFDATRTEDEPAGTREAMRTLFDAWALEAESTPPY